MAYLTNIYDKTSVITSRQNPAVIALSKLSDRKFRDAEGLFLLDGIKLVMEAAASGLDVKQVIMREDAVAKYSEKVTHELPTARVLILSESAFERVTDEKAPQGIIAVVAYDGRVKRTLTGEDELPSGQLLVLDAIQNPDNFGAILRSASAFGVKNAICGLGTADVYGRKTLRASMGAALRVGCAYTDELALACREAAASGRRVVATVPRQGAKLVYDFDFRDDDMIVIGNEGHGISDAVLSSATEAVYIPMEKGQESLNAAVAASVVLYEMYRQRNVK